MKRRPEQTGFTIYEALMVLVIMGIVVGILTPGVRRQLTRARINRAATIVAADLFMAQSISGRQRIPVRVTYSDTAFSVVIADSRSGGPTFVTRRFGLTSDFKLQSFVASPAQIMVLPNGMASAALTVTISGAGYTRVIRMTRAGLIRIT